MTNFGPRATALEVTAGLNLKGKSAIVTGAGSGLGIETARALAAQGAEVILAVRQPTKAEAVVADIRATTANDRVHAMAIDLSSFSSVRSFVSEFRSSHQSLHILINNAGIMTPPELQISECGHEQQFATNHLGHFLLTCLLAPCLISGAPSRVVNLSSMAHRLSGMRFDDINFKKSGYDKWLAYGQSKTACILFAMELDRRLASKGVNSYSVDPGGIMTNLQRNMDPAEFKLRGWVDENGAVNPAFKSTEQGASTSVYAATSARLKNFGGSFLRDNDVAETLTPESRDPNDAKRLWEISEEAVGQKFDF